jgi:hypothetical protein
MIKVGLGQAEGIDTVKTVNVVISKCAQQLEGIPPQAGIVLAANTFDHHRMLTEIHGRFPQIELIKCTTSGEFSSSYGFSDDSIILMTFYSDDLEIQAGVGRDLSLNPLASVQTAVSQARQNLTLPPRLGLAFPDGFNKTFSPIMKRTLQCCGGRHLRTWCRFGAVDDRGPGVFAYAGLPARNNGGDHHSHEPSSHPGHP